MSEPKVWWQSKTSVINAILIIVGLAMYIIEGVQSGQLKAPWALDEATLTFWYGVLGFILRYFTSRPVRF